MNYTTIESEEQYEKYAYKLFKLSEEENSDNKVEMDLIETLLEDWENTHDELPPIDSIQFLLSLMEIHTLSLKDLEHITGLSSETLVKMTNYEIDIPKETIPKLADLFKMREEAFMNHRIYK